MKHKKILIRTLLVILCLPSLSACLWKVGSASGTQYPIQGDGSVDMTGAPFTDIDGLRLRGLSLVPNQTNLSLECESGGAFSSIVGSNFSGMSLFMNAANTPDFWSLIENNCTIGTEGDNAVIKLALRVGDSYIPVFTPDLIMCFITKIQFERLGFYDAITSCVAADGRNSTGPLGLNTTAEEINILKLLVTPEYIDSISI